ncbi:hypothetical protein LQW54_005939 [Pestalotiopsis sp. IQ-011]
MDHPSAVTDYYTTPASIYFISIFFPILGVTCVALRFYTRAKAKNAFWWDDWLCIPALIFELAMAAPLLWGVSKSALGGHLSAPTDPSPTAYLFFTSPQQIILQQIQYFFDLIGVFAFGSLKLSIQFFYRKIFCVIIVWTLAFGIGAIFLCGARPAWAWAPVNRQMTRQIRTRILPFVEDP